MTDLDFDELDKAVNNLMGGKDQPQENTTKTSTLVSVSPSPSGPSGDHAVSSARNLAAPEPRPLATRRTGRFMDVMHPSSTMKPVAPVPAPSSEANSSTALMDEDNSEKSARDTAPVNNESAAPSIPSAVSPEPKSEWPDPVEFAAPSSVNTLAPSIHVPADTTPQDRPKDSEPSYSPFLSDAKVEKRPLGSPVPLGGIDDDTTSEDESAQLPAKAKDLEVALPDELHSDLLAIEAGTARHTEDESKEIDEVPLVEPKKTEELSSQPVEAKPDEYTGPTSIPQQYKEESAAANLESGAIYDTDTYHQPLTHPIKKKSGWLVVVWILLILILGAGVGAAFYLFWR